MSGRHDPRNPFASPWAAPSRPEEDEGPDPFASCAKQAPHWRPWEREKRLGKRWEIPPTNVVLREDMEDGADVGGSANNGRLSVYCFNFGEVSRPRDGNPVINHLADHTAHVFVAQEMTFGMAAFLRDRKWHLSAERFIGASRANGGDGLMIAARSQVCVGIDTFEELSGSVWGGDRERSSMLFAKVRLRWAMAGNTDYVFGNFHLHRETAKRGLGSSFLRDFIKRLANGCRASGARLLCGDANMGLFLIGPGMRHEGFECRLLMHHREMDIYKPLPIGVGAKGQIMYDSLGVWSIGPMSDKGLKRLTLSSRLMLGAMHPAVAEVAAKGGRLKVLTRGYPLRSYLMPQFEEEPDSEALDKVRLLWDLHGIEVLRPDAPAGALRRGAASSEEVWTLASGTNGVVESGEWNPVLELAATCKSHLYFEGERLQELRKATGIELTMEWTSLDGAPRGASPETDHLPPFPHIREMVNNWQKFDEKGTVWGLGGHWPLYFVVGSLRTQSKTAEVLRSIARGKVRWWRENNLWPWWVAHESEKNYWLPGDGDNARGYSGIACSLVLATSAESLRP